MRKIHKLKTHPGPFQFVWDGVKPYEIRKNDRGFVVGDILHLEEWDPADLNYSGRTVICSIGYMTEGGKWGLPEDLCVLGLRGLVRVDLGEKWEATQ